jgi:hypothetical protein
MASRCAKVEIRKARRRAPCRHPRCVIRSACRIAPTECELFERFGWKKLLAVSNNVVSCKLHASDWSRNPTIRRFKGATSDSAAMEVPGATQKRRVSRRRVFKGAQISFRGLRAAIDCTVRDISDLGARLIVESPIGVPDRFDLVQNGRESRFCRVVWRKATQIGVEFI